MAHVTDTDPMVCNDEVTVDDETLAAIDVGIRAADEGRVVSSEEAWKLVSQWISELSTQNRR